MKKAYSAPIVEKVVFSYDEQVVASQVVGGGTQGSCRHFVSDYGSTGCNTFDGGWYGDAS